MPKRILENDYSMVKSVYGVDLEVLGIQPEWVEISDGGMLVLATRGVTDSPVLDSAVEKMSGIFSDVMYHYYKPINS